MAATYLPLLLAATAPTPDDSSVTSLPVGQVDYLSHNWREEDVWSSWRSMTRQKNAIANGTRLENASWRTWWKQRNKLKTISPETLNWLKDSDVTWLYGPLHPGVDWYPLAKQSGSGPHDVLCSPCSPISPSVGYPSTKPILKHRSISEILSLPLTPSVDGDDDMEFTASRDTNQTQSSDSSQPNSRPFLLHTKSESHIARHVFASPYRKDSPPRTVSNHSRPTPSPEEDASNSASTGSEQDSATHSTHQGKKKHISFNTFVEQCIAIEKPKLKRTDSTTKPRFALVGFDDDGYDEDSEMDYDDTEDTPVPPTSHPFYPTYRADSDSDSDDPLEIQTCSSRSRSSSSSRDAPAHPCHQPSHYPPLDRQSSFSDKEHRTIAHIAPTILKTTGVGSVYGYEREHHVTGVELVYVPPIHGNHNGPRYGAGSVVSSHFRGAIQRQPSDSNLGGSRSDALPSLSVVMNELTLHEDSPYKSQPISANEEAAKEQSDWAGDDLTKALVHSEPISIPAEKEADIAIGGEDAFDYFGGPDLGEDFSKRGMHGTRIAKKSPSENQRENEVIKYADGGAESVVGGRNSAPAEKTSITAEPIEIASLQPPNVASPYSSVPVSRPISLEHSPESIQLLHSPEVPPTRGLISPTSASPVSGSTTSTTSAQSRSSDSRGRSSTRNSSLSDRERSGSRSSKGTSSPLGSISPSGSVIGIGGQYTSREGRATYVSGRERGRERVGRKLSGSVSSSPSNLSSPLPTSPTRNADYQPFQRGQSDLYSLITGSVSDSASSSGSNASSVGLGSQSSNSDSTVTGHPNESVGGRVSPAPIITGAISRNWKGISIPIPSPILEEEEQRSRHPTPANSPITAMRPALPLGPSHISSASVPTCPKPSSEEKLSEHSSFTPAGRGSDLDGEQFQAGTLVGRAVDIVLSARELFGSLWNTNSR